MVTQRSFDPADFEEVCRFLRQCYKPENRDGNWIQPIWDYAYHHGGSDPESWRDMGLWMDGDRVVAATITDVSANEVSLCTLDPYRSLKEEMLQHAELRLSRPNEAGQRVLNIFAHEEDAELNELLPRAGYERLPKRDRTFSSCTTQPPPVGSDPPSGYELITLEDENDLRKINQILWRGSNHEGDAPEEHIEGRRRMQSSPNFRFDLTVVAKAPSGEYVSYCGMWYDEDNAYGYVEPVATDPDHRRLGLGRAVVMESVRRCGKLGAGVAYVWSDTPFYRSVGFEPLFQHLCWTKGVKNGT